MKRQDHEVSFYHPDEDVFIGVMGVSTLPGEVISTQEEFVEQVKKNLIDDEKDWADEEDGESFLSSMKEHYQEDYQIILDNLVCVFWIYNESGQKFISAFTLNKYLAEAEQYYFEEAA